MPPPGETGEAVPRGMRNDCGLSTRCTQWRIHGRYKTRTVYASLHHWQRAPPQSGALLRGVSGATVPQRNILLRCAARGWRALGDAKNGVGAVQLPLGSWPAAGVDADAVMQWALCMLLLPQPQSPTAQPPPGLTDAAVQSVLGTHALRSEHSRGLGLAWSVPGWREWGVGDMQEAWPVVLLPGTCCGFRFQELVEHAIHPRDGDTRSRPRAAEAGFPEPDVVGGGGPASLPPTLPRSLHRPWRCGAWACMGRRGWSMLPRTTSMRTQSCSAW